MERALLNDSEAPFQGKGIMWGGGELEQIHPGSLNSPLYSRKMDLATLPTPQGEEGSRVEVGDARSRPLLY